MPIVIIIFVAGITGPEDVGFRTLISIEMLSSKIVLLKRGVVVRKYCERLDESQYLYGCAR